MIEFRLVHSLSSYFSTLTGAAQGIGTLTGQLTVGVAPALSNPVDTALGVTTAGLSVDTNEGTGILYWVVSTSATAPTRAQVKAGQMHTGAAAADSGSQVVSGAGTQNISGGATGLLGETQYFAHFMHEDEDSNQSNVASGDGFTTLDAWFVDNSVPLNGTGTVNSPWKEITDIDWPNVGAGQTIYISGGPAGQTYTSLLVMGKDGVRVTKRTDSGFNGTVTIDAQNNGIGINTNGKNNVNVDHLRVINTNDTCIFVDSATAGVVIEDNVVVAQGPGGGNARGIDVRDCVGSFASPAAIVRRNTITTAGNSTDQNDGIYAQGNDGVAIRNNRITISNIDSTGHSDAIQLYDNGDMEVSGNITDHPNGTSDNHGLWLSNCRTGKTYRVFNNVVSMKGLQAESGITCFNEDDPQWTGKFETYNNTSVGGLAPLNIDRAPVTSLFRNNLLKAAIGHSAIRIANYTPDAGDFNHNLIDTGSLLRVSAPTSATIGGVRSTTSKTADNKSYWEVTIGGIYAGGNSGIGIANSTQALNAFMGSAGNNSLGYYANGRLYINGGFSTTVQTYSPGDVIGLALDVGNKKLWVRNITTNSGWNNDVLANQNPANNTGGKDISAIAGPYFAGQSLSGTRDGVEYNFGRKPFVGVRPSGFSAWGSAVTMNPADLQTPASLIDVAIVGSTPKTWAQWQADSQDVNGVNEDAGFNDEENDDFTLDSSSGAVDAGETLADVTVDVLGIARPQGAAYDIGAYEHVPSGGAAEDGEMDFSVEEQSGLIILLEDI